MWSNISFRDGNWLAIITKHGEAMWLKVKGQLQEIVAQQQSEENEHLMSADEVLNTVLGDRIGYVCGKGTERSLQKRVVAVESMHQEMQAEMERKLQEKRE
ncbi:uncharacterized protein LOC132052758 [Lycium ferocissimum]|uniref:uncharacterized protein LOC132052758 n=1 Tax=Lycium ferocissimum TaxID=112874 RepID=UPI0028158A6F|nr:uncharacterized protein LOC132052758 [Lycium ferocissimum]